MELEILLGILPLDFLLIVVSSFLFSIYGLKLSEIKKEFVKERYINFVLAFGLSLLAVFAWNIYKLNNTPLVDCIEWQEFCDPFIMANTHGVAQGLFLISIGATIWYILGIFLDQVSRDIKDGRKKSKKLDNWINFGLRAIIYVVIIFGYLYGSPFVFLDTSASQSFQPIVFLQGDAHGDIYDFYFENNSPQDKLITKIEIEFHDTKQNYEWNPTNCSGLPAIIPKEEIKKLTCEIGDFNRNSMQVNRVTAYTGKYNYPTYVESTKEICLVKK